MPRHICIIRPDIWTDQRFNELSCHAKLLYLGLAGFLDCAGRALHDPDLIADQVFPGQAVPIHDLFEELEIMELIETYAAHGQTYIQLTEFARHQRPDRRRTSRLPDRDGKVAEIKKKTTDGPPAAGDVAPLARHFGVSARSRGLDTVGTRGLNLKSALAFEPVPCNSQSRHPRNKSWGDGEVGGNAVRPA